MYMNYFSFKMSSAYAPVKIELLTYFITYYFRVKYKFDQHASELLDYINIIIYFINPG